MSAVGQTPKYSLRADVFRSTPLSGHRETGPAGPVRATSGHHSTSPSISRQGEP